MKINKNNIKRFHKEVNGVLEGIAKKYNLKHIPGSLRYSDVGIRVKTEFVNLEDNSEIDAKVMDTPIDSIKAGLGYPGDKFWVIHNNAPLQLTILKCKLKKYLVQFPDNSLWNIRFQSAYTKEECERRLKLVSR